MKRKQEPIFQETVREQTMKQRIYRLGHATDAKPSRRRRNGPPRPQRNKKGLGRKAATRKAQGTVARKRRKKRKPGRNKALTKRQEMQEGRGPEAALTARRKRKPTTAKKVQGKA